MGEIAPLKVDQLTKNYGNLTAVSDVSFEMRPGEIFGLLGPNGAGKTSIISCTVSLESPTNGSVQVFGYDVRKNPLLCKSQIGLVPQEIVNHGYFSVEEILKFHSGYYGYRQNNERIDYLLERLALSDHRFKKVKQLSGGMKRRLLIAKALVHRPRLLLLDEPTAGVDIELRNSLWSFVEDLKKEGVSILLTTHYLEEAEKLCDRVGILHQGKLLRLGETKALIQDLTHRKIRLKVVDESLSCSHPHFMGLYQGYFEFSVPAKVHAGQLLSELKLDLKMISDIQIQEGNLEDAFRMVLSQRGLNVG